MFSIVIDSEKLKKDNIMSKTAMGFFELICDRHKVAEFHRGDSWLHCATSGPMLSFQIFDNSRDYLTLANLLDHTSNIKQEDPEMEAACQSFEFSISCEDENQCQLFIDTVGGRTIFTADKQSFAEMAVWIREQY